MVGLLNLSTKTVAESNKSSIDTQIASTIFLTFFMNEKLFFHERKLK